MTPNNTSLTTRAQFALIFGFTTISTKLFSLCPLKLFPLLESVFFILIRLFARKDLATLRSNIAHIWRIPEFSSFSTMFANQVIRSQIRTVMEELMIVLGRVKRTQYKLEGFEEIERLLSSKTHGVIFITAHLGCWELCAYFAAKALHSGKLFVLAKPTPSKLLTKFMTDFRERMNVEVLLNNSKTLFKDMIDVLKSGSSLGFVMDQKPDSGAGLTVQFFDQSTEFVSGPAKLALKYQNPVISIFCIRKGPWHYRIIAKELPLLDQNEVTMTQTFAHEIEEVIRLYPDQWTWSYRRWKF